MYADLVPVDETDMRRILRSIIILLLPATLILLAAHSTAVAPQSSDELEPSFDEAVALLHRAESAGATSEEVAELAKVLNRALELNDEAHKLTGAGNEKRRSELLGQVNEMLGNVQTDAAQLEVIASKRTLTHKVIAYTSGGISALVATIVLAYGMSFWRRYRVKRTFQMRIVPK